MDAHFELILPELEKAAAESSGATGPEPFLNSLAIMRRLFRSRNGFQAATFMNFVPNIQKILLVALNHQYSKVVYEGLRVTGSFLNALRDESGNIETKFATVSQPFYQAILAKLQKVDIDQDVKSSSIIAAA